MRQQNKRLSDYSPFAGADSALSRLLSGKTDSLIDKNEMLATAQDTVVNPLKLAQQRLLEEAMPAVNNAASKGGTRFSSRSGNVIGDLLMDANRSATSEIGSVLGQLEQFRLGANQAAKLQAEGLQVQGLGLARDRENMAFNRNSSALQNEQYFQQMRQQRMLSQLFPMTNPLLGQAMSFANAPTQQIVQVEPGGFQYGGTAGGIGQGALTGLFGLGV